MLIIAYSEKKSLIYYNGIMFFRIENCSEHNKLISELCVNKFKSFIGNLSKSFSGEFKVTANKNRENEKTLNLLIDNWGVRQR